MSALVWEEGVGLYVAQCGPLIVAHVRDGYPSGRWGWEMEWSDENGLADTADAAKACVEAVWTLRRGAAS